MKKIATWLIVISIVVFAIAWGIVGLKILDNNYDFITEAYIALGAMVVLFIAIICLKMSNRCPHCGNVKQSLGKYCPYCGKDMNG